MKQEVLRWSLQCYQEGLFAGTSGNLSCYDSAAGVMAITPTNLPYEGMTADDIVLIQLDGTPVEGRHLPSSEWRLHAAIYRARPDVTAVVHTHSPYATSFSVAGKGIPIILIEMVGYIGGAIPLARFAVPGTPEVGQYVVEAMGGSANACLMANHGAVAVGAGLEQAHLRAVYLEDAAKIATLAAINGGMQVISDENIAAQRAILAEAARREADKK